MRSHTRYQGRRLGLTQAELLLVIADFARWIQEYRKRGWKLYIVTIKFRQMGGNANYRAAAMLAEVERVQTRLITRFYRNPHQDPSLLPLWLVVPDFPVHKRTKKSSLKDVTVNDGLHMQAILAVPRYVIRDNRRRSGLRDRRLLEAHFAKNRPALFGPESQIASLYAERIRTDVERVVDYLFKSVKAGKVSYDQVGIFPNTGLCLEPKMV